VDNFSRQAITRGVHRERTAVKPEEAIMKTMRSIQARTAMGALALALACVMPAWAAAEELAAVSSMRVQVFPDHYAMGGQRLGDPLALEAAVRADAHAAVRLEHCGAASARPLLAAVERLHGAQVAVVEIHRLPGGVPGCAPGADAGSAHLAKDAAGYSLIP
jgi:hypothetical protein